MTFAALPLFMDEIVPSWKARSLHHRVDQARRAPGEEVLVVLKYLTPCINCIWWPVASRVPEGSVLGPDLLNAYTNKLDNGAECALCKGTQS